MAVILFNNGTLYAIGNDVDNIIPNYKKYIAKVGLMHIYDQIYDFKINFGPNSFTKPRLTIKVQNNTLIQDGG